MSLDSQLPQELFEEILKNLSQDINALKSCAVSCSLLLPLSQKYLFSKVVLRPPDYERTGRKYMNGNDFKDLLDKSPHIGNYVDCFQVTDVEKSITTRRVDHDEWLSQDTALTSCLPRLRNLKALIIQYRSMYDAKGNWDRLCNQGVLSVLLDAISLPSLVYLDLTNMPVKILNHCPHVRHLVIRSPTFTIWGPARDTLMKRTRTPIVLESLRLNYSDHADTASWFLDNEDNGVDISHLKRLYYPSEYLLGGDTYVEDLLHLSRLLHACSDSLEELFLEPDVPYHAPEYQPPPSYTNDEASTLNFPVLKSLRKISVRFALAYSRGLMKNPFPWLIQLLKTFPLHPNSIQELVLYLDYDWQHMNINLSEFTKLTAILQDDNRFGSFRTLSIHISSTIKGHDLEIVRGLKSRLKKFVKNPERKVCIMLNPSGLSAFLIRQHVYLKSELNSLGRVC